MFDLMGFCKSKQLKFDGKIAYGIYNKRVINIRNNVQNIFVSIAFNSQIESEMGQKIAKTIHDKIKTKYRVLSNAIVSNINTTLIFYQSNDLETMFVNVLDQTIALYEELQLPGCEICPICTLPLPSDSKFLRIKENVIQAHDSCINSVISSVKNVRYQFQNESKKNIKANILYDLFIIIFIIGLSIAFSFLDSFKYFSFLIGYVTYLLLKRGTLSKRIRLNKAQIIAQGVLSYLLHFVGILICFVIAIYTSNEQTTMLDAIKNLFPFLFNHLDVLKLAIEQLMVGYLLITMLFVLKLITYKKQNELPVILK